MIPQTLQLLKMQLEKKVTKLRELRREYQGKNFNKKKICLDNVAEIEKLEEKLQSELIIKKCVSDQIISKVYLDLMIRENIKWQLTVCLRRIS